MDRIIKLVVSLGFWTFCWVRNWFIKLFGMEIPGTCVVLYYHSINSKHRNRFARQMDYIIQHAKPIPADIDTPLERGVHHAAITFDDGFQSVLENALPELVTRNIPFTIFVPTGYLGRHPEWITNPNSQDRHDVVMTKDQLRELSSDLITIGSHTVTHPRLTLQKEDEARKELFESRKELEYILGHNVTLFSFPHGEYNHKLEDLAEQAGYRRVFTILPKLAFLEPKEYRTGRVHVTPNDWHLEFHLKLFGAYRWLPIVYILKRKMSLIMNHFFTLNYNFIMNRKLKGIHTIEG